MQTNFNTYSDVNEDGCVTVVKKAKRALMTYEDIGEAAFGEFGRSLISWVLYESDVRFIFHFRRRPFEVVVRIDHAIERNVDVIIRRYYDSNDVVG